MTFTKEKLGQLQASLTPTSGMRFVEDILPLWQQAATELPKYSAALAEAERALEEIMKIDLLGGKLGEERYGVKGRIASAALTTIRQLARGKE